MKDFLSLSQEEIKDLYYEQKSKYDLACTRGLKLDMSRGKPSPEQTLLGQDILLAACDASDLIALDGTDCRNYGGTGGIREAKDLFSQIISVPSSNIYIGGVSSLNLMFDTISRAMIKGLATSSKPWAAYDKISFLCPVPGYDRHYSILEYFGINMIPVPMTGHGPDMDIVERIASEDDTVKGIWCIPVYSNPTGDVYSDETIKRLASLNAKAEDFTVFYDNAYPLHALYGEFENPISFFDECIKSGHPERPVIFASLSKVTFAGGSICCIGLGNKNFALANSSYSVQCLTHDKINQLRHTRVFKNIDDVKKRMLQHADVVAPKFRIVTDTLSRELKGSGLAKWSEPKGGYFIALYLNGSSAKRVVGLCAQAGVKLTSAGAGYPYNQDPDDAFIRIAPTYPSEAELSSAVDLLCNCIILASCEKALNI